MRARRYCTELIIMLLGISTAHSQEKPVRWETESPDNLVTHEDSYIPQEDLKDREAATPQPLRPLLKQQMPLATR